MPRIEFIVPESPNHPFSLPATDGFSATIGRDEDCEICIPIASVSSRHAVVERIPGGIQIRDSGSTNGLVVDGERVDSVLLTPSIRLHLGEAVLVYSETQEERDMFNSELRQGLTGKTGTDPWAEEEASESGASDASRAPVVRIEREKQNYVPMVLYAIIVFALAVVAGMTYQHYKRTGNLLPLIWMGREPLPEKVPAEGETK